MMRHIGIEILNLVLFERRPINGIGRAESMFKGRASSDIAKLCLHNCSQVSRRVVSEFNYLARLTFENDNHTASDLGCRNSHKTEFSV
jgi:hypothetical protein